MQESPIAYYADDYENAIIRVMPNDDRYVRFFRNGKLEGEFKANLDSKVAYGSMENTLLSITKNQYNSFSKTWWFDVYCEITYNVKEARNT